MSDQSAGAGIARAILRFLRWCGRLIRGEMVRRVGGTARARVILIFGLVLALNGADLSTVGSIAPQLEASLHIDNLQIGLLTSVSLVVGAIVTIPVGLFVDRLQRVPLLSVSIVLWSVASLLSAFAGSYETLLLTRLFLGAVVATAGPAIASLTGDYFPSQERARIYAYILGGEVAGQAVGFIVGGNIASAISWRAAFLVLAVPGFFLARELYRTVPEPLRGGQSHLLPGTVDLVQAAAEARATTHTESLADDDELPKPQEPDFARVAAERLGAQPNPDLILVDDPRRLTLIDSVRYVLSIPTNVLMIISSSLGYFFFSGLSTYALLFVRGHYHVGQATSSLVLALLVGGALVGTLVSGWLSDAVVRRGYLNARVWFPAICYLSAAALLVPGIVSDHLTPAIWFDTAGAALLSAANPPLDAARLDIMPAGLWGRAESVRTTVRSLAQALAPLLFGGLSDLIAGVFPKQAPPGTHPGTVTPGDARGLEITFLVMLMTLAAGGIALLRARFTYAQDVATAAASNQGSGAPSVLGRDTHTLDEDTEHQEQRRSRERRSPRNRRRPPQSP
jgi:MFS family permease